MECRRPDEATTLVAAVDDVPVLDFDPRAQIVGFAITILVAQPLELALAQLVRRRLVVMAEAEFERDLRQPLDRLRGDPGDRFH